MMVSELNGFQRGHLLIRLARELPDKPAYVFLEVVLGFFGGDYAVEEVFRFFGYDHERSRAAAALVIACDSSGVCDDNDL